MKIGKIKLKGKYFALFILASIGIYYFIKYQKKAKTINGQTISKNGPVLPSDVVNNNVENILMPIVPDINGNQVLEPDPVISNIDEMLSPNGIVVTSTIEGKIHDYVEKRLPFGTPGEKAKWYNDLISILKNPDPFINLENWLRVERPKWTDEYIQYTIDQVKYVISN
jgi:hypothetical protein